MTSSIAEKAVRDGLSTLKKETAPWSPDVRNAFAKVEKAGKAILAPNTKKTQTPSAPDVTDDLRHAFVPLYEHFTADALQLAAAIFTVCVKQRAVLERDKGDDEGAERWEGVAAAVIDGVLDFHDKDESNATKLAISRAFYKNIAVLFFASGPSSSSFSISLRQNVYTLLYYTATHQAENQEMFRGLIPPSKLGQVIYACKDSLPQDELLNTLGVVLPRVRKGPPANRARASQILRECFDQPSIHPAGAEIARHVESKLEKTTEWSETVEEIGALLARDISLPQPFQHTVFQAGGLEDPPKRVQPRFFVDRHSFVFYNEAEEEGTYDTFIVGFNTVAHMSVSKTGLVTGQLTSPPGGGPRGALARRSSGTVPLSLMFKVEVGRAKHLYNTLVDRKLKSVAWKDMTQSKTRMQFSVSQEPARLDFVDGKNAFEPSTSEKARVVAEGVDKTSEPGDEQPIGDELAFAAETLRVPVALPRAQHEPKQPRARDPLPSLTEKLTQITTPGSTPVPRPEPIPSSDISPGPYIESPPSTSPAKPAPARLPSFSHKFTDLLTKANSTASKPTSIASKPDSSKSKAVVPTSSKAPTAALSKPGATLPKKPSITHEDWVTSSQERRAEFLGDLFGSPDTPSDMSDLSDDDSIPEPARLRARKAQENAKGKEKSLKGGGKAGMRIMDSNDAPPLAPTSTRKRKAVISSEHGGSQLERRHSPRLSQAAPAAEEDVPMVHEPASVFSPPRFPSLVAQDAPVPAAAHKKPRPRPKGKAVVANDEDEVDPPAPVKNAMKKADALASASDTSPPVASKKTSAQKPAATTTKAPAAPKKKVKPVPTRPACPAELAESRTRPTRASAAAASKKIAHDAGVLIRPTQSSSLSGEAHESSSTAVEGHRERSAASASVEPEHTKPSANRSKLETEPQKPSSSPPAASTTRDKRKREEEAPLTSEASTVRPTKRHRGDPKTPAAHSQLKPKAPPARPTKPAARKYGAPAAGKDKNTDAPAAEANFDDIPGSSPKSPLEEMLAQTRGPRSSSPAPLSVAGPSKVGAMRGKGAGAKEKEVDDAGIEASHGKREVKRLPRRVAAQRAPHLSPRVESEHTDNVVSVALASTTESLDVPARQINATTSRRAPQSHHVSTNDVEMLEGQVRVPAAVGLAAPAPSKSARDPARVQSVAPEFDFGGTSRELEETVTAAPVAHTGRGSEHSTVEDMDIMDILEIAPGSAKAPVARRQAEHKRTTPKETTLDDATLRDDIDMLDVTITDSPPHLSVVAKGKARLSSPIVEASIDVADVAATLDVNFDLDTREEQEPALDFAKEDAKASDKSSSSSSYRGMYTDITLPLKGEKEGSAPPFDVYMSYEDVSIPSFDEEPEERVVVRSKKSVAFVDSEPETQQPPAPLAPYNPQDSVTAPRASRSSNKLSPIRIDYVEPQQERPRLFQHKVVKAITPPQPHYSGLPRRVPIKARAQAVVEEKQKEQEPKDRVLDILDEIHAIVKAKIRTGFDGVDQRVVNMRKRFLRQAADDIRAQLPDYIATYNELLALHEAYSAFAVRKQAAISHAEQLANEGVRQVKEIIRAHDIRANEVAKNRPKMPPLPPSVTKWLS